MPFEAVFRAICVCMCDFVCVCTCVCVCACVYARMRVCHAFRVFEKNDLVEENLDLTCIGGTPGQVACA
jgi:hypothetical protein